MKIGDRVRIGKTEYQNPLLGTGNEGVVADCCDVAQVALIQLDNGYKHSDPFGSMLLEASGCRCDGWNYEYHELEVLDTTQ